jgi:hypothetical protein
MRFDGINNVATAPAIISGATQFTISLWVKRGVTGAGQWDGAWFSASKAYNGGFFLGNCSDTTTVFQYWIGGSRITRSMDTSIWNNVVIRYQSAVLRESYLNGIAQIDAATTNTIASHTSTELGKNLTTSLPFPGWLSDVSVWNRVLSLSEIQQLADPSNVYLSGLIVPPKRRLWTFKLPEVAPPATTTKKLGTYSRHRKPSLTTGYASCANESKYPELWKGLVGAWIPMLGNVNGTILDVSHKRNISVGTSITDWGVDSFGSYIRSVPNTGKTPIPLMPLAWNAGHPFTLHSVFTKTTGTSNYLLAAWSANWSTDYPGFEMFLGAGGTLRFIIGAAATADAQRSIGTIITNIPYAGTIIYNGNIAKGYLNGKWGVDSAPIIMGTHTCRFTLYNVDPLAASFSGNYAHYGKSYATFLWDRTISLGDMAHLVSDPLAPFYLRNRIFASSVASASSPVFLPSRTYKVFSSSLIKGVTPRWFH